VSGVEPLSTRGLAAFASGVPGCGLPLCWPIRVGFYINISWRRPLLLAAALLFTVPQTALVPFPSVRAGDG